MNPKPFAVCLALGLMSLTGGAETLQYAGTSSSSDWWDAGNWKINKAAAGRVPQAGDDVVFPAAQVTPVVCSLTNSTPRLNSLSVNQGWNLKTSGWETKIQADEVIVGGIKTPKGVIYKGTISCAGPFSELSSNRVHIVCNTLTVNDYGWVSADGTGYPCACGPAWEGATCTTTTYLGGGYGGRPQLSSSPNDYPHVYGSVTAPTDPGAGGGNTTAAQNTIGGGVIRLEVSGAVTVSAQGSISADGSDAQNYCGSGSGGSVWITCNTVSGEGIISASAKDKASGSTAINSGGGRIALYYDSDAQSAVADCRVHVRALGGRYYRFPYHYDYQSKGEPQSGTLCFTDDYFLRGPVVRVGGRVFYGPNATAPTALSYAGDLTIDSGVIESDADDFVLTVAGDLTISGTNRTDHNMYNYGLRLNGQRTRISVGGDLSVECAMIDTSYGSLSSLSVDGSCLFGATSAADVYLQAMPTNDEQMAFTSFAVGQMLTVTNGSTLCVACDKTNGAIVAMSVAQLQVCEDSFISAKWTGYGLGKGPGLSSKPDYGASHGGLGGSKNASTERSVGVIYGNTKVPQTPGSSTSTSNKGEYLNRGGGVVFLNVAGAAEIDGAITADGEGARAGQYQGSASGGSVYLRCEGRLSGSGTVSADGGIASTAITPSGARGGNGGGGRVAIRYGSIDPDSTLAVHALGGGQTAGVPESADGTLGGNGTVYMKSIGGIVIMVR